MEARYHKLKKAGDLKAAEEYLANCEEIYETVNIRSYFLSSSLNEMHFQSPENIRLERAEFIEDLQQKLKFSRKNIKNMFDEAKRIITNLHSLEQCIQDKLDPSSPVLSHVSSTSVSDNEFLEN